MFQAAVPVKDGASAEPKDAAAKEVSRSGLDEQAERDEELVTGRFESRDMQVWDYRYMLRQRFLLLIVSNSVHHEAELLLLIFSPRPARQQSFKHQNKLPEM